MPWNDFFSPFFDSIFTDPSSAANAKPSKTFGFNPCSGGVCGRPAVRPLVDTGAMVFVVFGILGVNRTERRDNHVIGDLVSGPPLPSAPSLMCPSGSRRR